MFLGFEAIEFLGKQFHNVRCIQIEKIPGDIQLLSHLGQPSRRTGRLAARSALQPVLAIVEIELTGRSLDSMLNMSC